MVLCCILYDGALLFSPLCCVLYDGALLCRLLFAVSPPLRCVAFSSLCRLLFAMSPPLCHEGVGRAAAMVCWEQRHLCAAPRGPGRGGRAARRLSLLFGWRRSLLSGTNARKNVDIDKTIERNMLELLKEVF